METFSEVNESYTVYGRDEMEQLYIIPQVLLNGKNISAYIIGLSQKMHVDTDYMTIVYDRETCRREELQIISRDYTILWTQSAWWEWIR